MFDHVLTFCFKDGRKPVSVVVPANNPTPMPNKLVGMVAEILPDVDVEQIDHYHEEIIPLTPEALLSGAFGALVALAKEAKAASDTAARPDDETGDPVIPDDLAQSLKDRIGLN